MTEAKAKKVIPFSVRFDEDLFDDLDKVIYSIPRAERPSKDAVVQRCVRLAISRPELRNALMQGTDPEPEAKPALHVLPGKKRKGIVPIEVPEQDVAIYQALHRLLSIPKRGPAVSLFLDMLLELVADPVE